MSNINFYIASRSNLQKSISILLFFWVGLLSVEAQFHPVQITTQLIPPYSVYLTDYATPGNEKLRLVVVQRDFTKPSYQIRLQLTVELNGRVVLRTSPSFNPAPINLDPGIPMVISGADLQPYVDSRNLDFIGINRNDYEHTKALPEGSYQICFTAYDYKRQEVPVSSPGCSFFWLSKNEPPLINFPACGTALPYQNPQQIIFSWLPRNTSSPTSANDTEYEFTLYETRPAGRNPNDVVLSSQPVYRATTTRTQMVYGPAEPILLRNITYVWRVRAIDTNGKDAFRNNGYSEVCTFIYGGEASTVQLLPVEGLQAEGETERRAKAWWTPQENVTGYKINYKKKGSGYQWFSKLVEKDSLSFFDLEADTEYELRVQAIAGASYGPYSDIRPFKTLPKKVYHCGDEVPVNPPKGVPLPFATTGMIIDVQGIEMTIKEVSGPMGEGLYKGKGEVSIPYFGGAVFNVVFDRLYINDKRTAVDGRIDFLTKGVEEWVKDELEKQQKEKLAKQQEDNREQWKDTDFYEKVFYYKDIAIDSMFVNTDGDVMMLGNDGKTYVNKDIPAILADAPAKAIIFEDKNGDQWVVQAGGKVTKVPGGGLSPTYNVVVSGEALDIVKKALLSLYTDYDEAVLQTIAQEKEQRQATLQDHITTHNNQITQTSTADPVGENTFEPLFFDFEQSSDQLKGEDQFVQLSEAAKEKELEHNRGLLLHVLGSSTNIEVANPMVAKELKVGDQVVSAFVTSQKQSGKSEAEIVTAVKEAIKLLMDSLLIEASLDLKGVGND